MAIAIINADRALSIFVSTAWFPTVGKEGPLYFAQDTEVTYRWDANSGTYVQFASATGTGVTDHGLLTGLADDDHPQYALDTDLTTHIVDAVGAHAASAIANTPAGNIAATTVQAAIDELDSEKRPAVAPAEFRAYQSTAQSITANVSTKVLYQTAVYDVGSVFSTANSWFIAPTPGLYMFLISTSYIQQTDGGRAIIDLYKNGVFANRIQDITIGALMDVVIGGCAILRLVAGDKIEAYAYVNPTTLTLRNRDADTFFAGVKLND